MSLGSAYKSLSATYIDGITAPINYIKNSGWENLNIGYGGNGVWSTFSTTITSGLPTGTIGVAAGTSSIGPTISQPLNGTSSLSWTVSAALAAGNGFLSPAFFINREDQASILTTKFAYEVASGVANLNFSGVLGSQTIGIYFYDLTNSAWVIPTGSLGMNQSSGPSKVSNVTFQTPAVSFGNRFQLAIIATQATAGAFSVKFDSFSCGPQTSAIGVPATDPISYTPVTSGIGSPSSVEAFWLRDAGNMYLTGKITLGTTTGVNLQIGLPLGSSISSALAATTHASGAFTTNAGTASIVPLITGGTNYIQFGNNTAGTGLTPILGTAYSSGAIISYSVGPIPIQGWSSNVQMSSDTDTRVVALTAGRTSATYNYTADTPIVFNVISQDTHGAYNTTTGQYLTPVSGFYSVESFIEFSGTIGQGYVYVAVAGTQFGGKKGWMSNTTGTLSSSKIVYANAGQTIDVRCGNTNSIAAAQNYSLSIQRLAGPSVIAASETISASYWVSANFAASTTVPINFDSKEYDDHGAVTTSATAWKFVAPIGGLYSVKFFGEITTGSAGINLFKNGSLNRPIAFIQSAVNNGGTCDIRLNAGEYLDIRPSGSVTFTGGILSNGNLNIVQFLRVGN
jgi:hypothetical protein